MHAPSKRILKQMQHGSDSHIFKFPKSMSRMHE